MLSIIVPALEEAATIGQALSRLQGMRAQGAEVIVVDGGSADATMAQARPLADRVVSAPRGRAAQMNAGAALAQGDVLLFLHADTRLPDGAGEDLLRAIADPGLVWGRFDVAIDSPRMALKLVSRMMNLRSRLSGIATGDQAIFVRADAFHEIGGFPSLPLMEDIAISSALRRISRPACLRAKVTTSARRWHRHGVARTIVLMWRLRLAYALGVDPARLAGSYGYAPPREHRADG